MREREVSMPNRETVWAKGSPWEPEPRALRATGDSLDLALRQLKPVLRWSGECQCLANDRAWQNQTFA